MAKETTASASPEEQTAQPQARPCPQNCLLCSMPQQVFCASKMLFDLSRSHMEAVRQIAELERQVSDIRLRLVSVGDSEALSTPDVEK